MHLNDVNFERAILIENFRAVSAFDRIASGFTRLFVSLKVDIVSGVTVRLVIAHRTLVRSFAGVNTAEVV